jgi:undecaprenyl-diphosphatase
MRTQLIEIWQRAGRKEFVLLLSMVMVCVCLWAFVEISEEVGEGDHAGFEAKIMKSMRRLDHPELLRGPDWLAVAARDITALGGPAAIVLIAGLTTGYLLLSRRLAVAGFILAAVGGGFAMSIVLKHRFGRARPEVVPHLMEEFSSSFPSGHSMSSAVVYITLGALLARSAPRWRDKVYLIGSALLLSGLIGISRVAMGVHYPTDVLAGWVAGTGWALICWTVAYWLQLHERYPAAISPAQNDE